MQVLKQCCNLLEQKKLTIAFIESASSGYLSSQFSIYKHSGADILLGGLVSYDPSIKYEILKIDPALIQQFTAESSEVTEAMALQGHRLFRHADIIVSCTGHSNLVEVRRLRNLKAPFTLPFIIKTL